MRLPFGLRCSPCMLMLALYYILVINAVSDSQELKELKQLMYQLFYMDNGGVAFDTSDKLEWAFNQLENVFKPYKLDLQQYVTNDQNLQSLIDSKSEVDTPDTVKLLGLQWNRVHDTLTTQKMELNINANSKRQVLKTIASQFDLYNLNGPILNRARLFLHKLQCNKSLGWDDILSSEHTKEWHNIAKQVNSAPEFSIPRFIGSRDDEYRLIAFTDASKQLYGAVLFIESFKTGTVSFVLARNRIVNRQLETQSIPSLEFQAISLGTELLIDTFLDLSGPTCIKPLKITQLCLYTDSLVCLHWLSDFSNKLSKMQKRSVFVMNRLKHIDRLCETFPIEFSFVSGFKNPADCITRCLSPKQLSRSNYFCGPDLSESSQETQSGDIFSVIIPNPSTTDDQVFSGEVVTQADKPIQWIPVENYSDFHCLVNVYRKVFLFIQKLKNAVGRKHNSDGYSSDNTYDFNSYQKAVGILIKHEQTRFFPEICKYFSSNKNKVADIPSAVTQYNIFPDHNGILRVKGKFFGKGKLNRAFPIFLPKDSHLTKLIITEIHVKYSHAGCYAILAELRKKFFIPHYFSVVKSTLRKCVNCKRFNERTVKLNQNAYRDFRVNPSQKPFSYMYLDYLGPFTVKNGGKKVKRWLLCFTCMWSRAINLKVCQDLSVAECLRAFQLHIFEYGIPQFCISDLGSQLTAASNKITGFLHNAEVMSYFEEQGIQPIKFEHFFKGCSQLGVLVEVCVKCTKRLLFGAVKNNILDEREFEFIVCQTVHIANRRPVAFKKALRDAVSDDIPDPITPESLVHGCDLASINIIPELQPVPTLDPSWGQVPTIRDNYHALRKVRDNLNKIYHSEFIGTLMKQSIDKKGRYKPVSRSGLQKGDLVLIKEEFTKAHNYPMAVVVEIISNDLGEVTGALVRKGKNREVVKRHSSVLIPILSRAKTSDDDSSDNDAGLVDMKSSSRRDNDAGLRSNSLDSRRDADNAGDLSDTSRQGRAQRRAAVESRERTRKLLNY